MSAFERWSVWVTTAGTLVTGVVYWWMKDMMAAPDAWSVINHPLQPWVLKAHILIAPLLVFSVGLITMRHIWRHYRSGVGKGRRTGITTALVLVPMVATGYLLQVVTGESLMRILAWTHLGLGVIYSLGLAAHWPATRSVKARDRRYGAHAPRNGRRPGARPGAPVGAGTSGERGGLDVARVPDHDRRRRGGGRESRVG